MRARFRDIFAMPAGGETVRAYLLFGFLLLILLGIAGQLAFREVRLKALTSRLDLVRHEAQLIADVVARIGGEGGSIDFSLVRKNADTLKKLIYERLSQRDVIHHVEIIDRFGICQLMVTSPPRSGRTALPFASKVIPIDWPKGGGQVVTVPLSGAEGEVRVGLFSTTVLSELERIRQSLRFKVGIAAALAVAVLVSGFFYVLYLIRKNVSLERSRQSAERAADMGRMAQNLVHEIRNPLNAMNMNLQMLQEEMKGHPDLKSEDWGELLQDTMRDIQRIENLAQGVLNYSRSAEPNFEERDINAIIMEVVRLLEVDFRRTGVELITALQPLLPRGDVDETQLKQVMMNLLVNANQVLGAEHRVTVRTRAGSKGEIVIEVNDDGPGMVPEVKERIFELFYSRRGGGTGLGLPIAKQIVERHGGTIQVDSVRGRGTTFTIRLPRRHDRPLERPEAGETKP
jgi:signal transduction histidine kinase